MSCSDACERNAPAAVDAALIEARLLWTGFAADASLLALKAFPLIVLVRNEVEGYLNRWRSEPMPNSTPL